MKLHRLLFFLLILAVTPLYGGAHYKFRVYLKDKGGDTTLLLSPSNLISPEAIERRVKAGLPIDSTDLPIYPPYIHQLETLGCTVVTTSRWANTVVVKLTDTTAIEGIKSFSFVESTKLVWVRDKEVYPINTDFERIITPDHDSLGISNIYGDGYGQIKIHNGDRLHEAGYRGMGVRIAVIDGGFRNANRLDCYRNTPFLGAKSFVYGDTTLFTSHYHGQRVLSAMAANMPGVFVGTAPEASYLLLKSEETETEFPVEEDYWTAAVEYADSVGVDIITSSLGYYKFDDGVDDYRYRDLDGETAFITRTANTATRNKGIFVILSAGNEGNGAWRYITFPSDSRNVLTVSAIDEGGVISSFSSVGPTADSRLKPDVVSLGSSTTLIDTDGAVICSNGTSYATPIVAGLVACLKQALPQCPSSVLMDLIKRNGNNPTPNAVLGYGIPDFYKCLMQGLQYEADKRSHPSRSQ